MLKPLLPRGYKNATNLSRRIHKQSEEVWLRKGQQRALKLFFSMAERVPAYKDFLKSQNFSVSSVGSFEDFKKIPTVDKDNYLRKYPKEMLCWDGEFADKQWVISTTSGSTGQPYYFPHEQTQDLQYSIVAEQYLRNNFDIQNKSTLYIVAFPMGAWIGGVFTYEALRIIARGNNYNLSIITPGIHKQEVINAVKQLGSLFDQIIIGAYAPFLKDILDDGKHQGINWSKYRLGFVFSAEAFSEAFRDYVAGVAQPTDILRFSLNHYGTVDQGTIAHETPETILIRRKLVELGKLNVLFPEITRQPTFCQYNPELFYFEQVANNLICSSYSGLPLVRYDLKDYGGVSLRSEVFSKLTSCGVDIENLIEEFKIGDITANFPYVYVYERNDFSVSYYAFLIYPDMIRRALQSTKLQDLVTGKFTMLVDYDKTGRQRLYIHIEKKFGVNKPNLAELLVEQVHSGLQHDSSEYRETFKMVGEIAKPLIQLWEYEDSTYFKSGTKQKWVT